MRCTNCVEKEQYDRVVKERDEWKHRSSCFKAAYEKERVMMQKYFKQAAQLLRDRNAMEAKYGEAKPRLEERYAELEKLRKENESMRNSLRDKREGVLDTTMENEKLRLEIDNITRANSSLRAERDEVCEQIKSLREKYESMSNRYAKAFKNNGINLHTVSARIAEIRKENDTLRAERDRAYEDATRQRTDYTNLMSECATLKKMKDDFCIEACHLRSALHARNALLHIMFLATGLHEDMLQELFNCYFHTSEASFDADLTRRMIQHCINNNSTIIDTTTGFRFDIAERLQKALAARGIYGEEAEGKEAKPNARCRKTKKKRDVRAKPEQSQRHAEGVARKRSFKKKEN